MRIELLIRPAARVRSRDDGASRRLAGWVGLVLGAVSALLPSGYFDVQGAGLVGGAVYALYGVTAASPLLLTALLCAAIGGDHESGLCRDVFLCGGHWRDLHLGAIVQGARSWAWLTTAAVVAGALVGLGDGWRHSAALNHEGFSLASVAMCLALQCYVTIVAASAAMVCRRSLAPVLVLIAVLAAGIITAPLARNGGWDNWLQILPYSPLVSQLDAGLLGRLSLPSSPQVAVAVMALWIAVGGICVVLRERLTPAPR